MPCPRAGHTVAGAFSLARVSLSRQGPWRGEATVNENAPHILEIYEPDSADDVRTTFKSPTPFQAVAVGDLVTLMDASVKQVLEVTRVEHIVWDGPGGQPKHKLCVYTKAVENTRASRHPR